MDNDMVRQGDVLIRRLDMAQERRLGRSHPVPARKEPACDRLVLAEGEATGHHHSIALSSRVALFREDGSGGGLFLSVTGEAPVMLEHQEHRALPVGPGTHAVIRQRVFSSDLARRVAD